ncbi:cation ABC transporter permease [Microbacterium testaceum]|uniref:Cation ABC transporter permease n=1 Tax=Microbacterium testaceum TaxID=2033 RepID=A0A147F214_MICTE|nr:metal ABC transporter permease [Microbacterium testaceum]KTR96814.1 cation ABC transporter permease [Microbacterium testaceum]
MFAPYLMTAWAGGTIVAVVAGIVGFFVVLRGNAFFAHAVPHGAFAGAAGAVLIGVNPLVGLGVFAVGGAVGIVLLGRRARHDVVTALTLVTMLALGALFLSRSREYSAEVFALLFGQILGVAPDQLLTMGVLGLICVVLVACMMRPLLLASVAPALAASRGVRVIVVDLVFAVVIAAATTVSVPMVGALLMFALLIAPPASAQILARTPGQGMLLSVALTLVTVWASIALAVTTDLPIGFFATAIGAVLYAGARGTAYLRKRGG